jgi:hypothetical protein
MQDGREALVILDPPPALSKRFSAIFPKGRQNISRHRGGADGDLLSYLIEAVRSDRLAELARVQFFGILANSVPKK